MNRALAAVSAAALITSGLAAMAPTASALSAVQAVPTCQPGQVFYVMWMTDGDDEMKPNGDKRYLFLHAKNESTTTCSLDGAPKFSFYGSQGTKFNVTHRHGGNLMKPQEPALNSVVLEPNYQTGMYVEYPVASTPETKEWTTKVELHAAGTNNTEKVRLFEPEEALTITEGTTVITSSWYKPEIAESDIPGGPGSGE